MKFKNWTIEEDNFLIENYPKEGTTFCMKKLNRTKRSIELRKQKLKLKYTGVKNKWEKENVEKAVKNSINYIQCLKKLTINNFGSSSKTLKKYIKKYEINTSHFMSVKESLKQTVLKNTIPLVDILVENSSYTNRSRLKNRLYNEGLKKRICEKCGQTEDWNGEHMSLILDHINGLNNDHRIENLRIVCANCNATLPTHCRSAYKNK